MATFKIQPGEFISPIITDMIVFQICVLDIISLILWLLLEMTNFTMKRV